MRRAEIERRVQHHASVVHLDGVDLDRPPRAGLLFLPRLSFHDRGEIPAAVRHARHHDARTDKRDSLDDDTVLDQLADAVAERYVIDLDERAALAREPDVTQLNATQERSLK